MKQLHFALLALLLIACNNTESTQEPLSKHGLLNTTPEALPQRVSLNEDERITVTLQGEDKEKQSLTYTITKHPEHGTLTGKAPNLTYIPDKDYYGNDRFAFTVNDGYEDSDEATVSLDIKPVNDAPVAKDDVLSLDEDSTVTIDVLTNDKDVDKDEKLKVAHIFKPSHGVATLKGNNIVYRPEPNFNGQEAFNYKVADSQGATSIATVRLTVKPVNDAPVAKDDAATTPVNTPIVINVLGNDTDIDDNEKLTLLSVTPSKQAKVAIKRNKIEYIPGKDYTGTEKLSYTIKDKHGATAQATLTVTVREPNDKEKYAQLENSGVVPKLDRSKTLGGIDSDNNGIRDDVDDYINNTYTKPDEKAAARQMARAYQNILLVDKNNLKAVYAVDKLIGDAINCAIDVAPNTGILNDIKAVTLNTKARVKEFFKYDDLLDGTVSTLPQGDTCER